MSHAAEHNSVLAVTQDETEQMRVEATRLEGLRVAAVWQSSALSMRLDSASAESVLLRSEVWDLRREVKRLRGERDAADESAWGLRQELAASSGHAADMESALRQSTEYLEWVNAELAAQGVTVNELRAELQNLQDAAGAACAWLTPPSLLPLSERLAALPGHVDRVVWQAAFFGSSMSLAQAVSHFDELCPVLRPIAEFFAGGLGDEEVERLEEEVQPHAMTISSRVEPASLLRRAEAE
ncbi:hypothetical protein BS78_02G180200 [Paspalum vaginatum]|nr:hypothetical protein BS78_02G180200 [Paspalum vaginatum]